MSNADAKQKGRNKSKSKSKKSKQSKKVLELRDDTNLASHTMVEQANEDGGGTKTKQGKTRKTSAKSKKRNDLQLQSEAVVSMTLDPGALQKDDGEQSNTPDQEKKKIEKCGEDVLKLKEDPNLASQTFLAGEDEAATSTGDLIKVNPETLVYKAPFAKTQIQTLTIENLMDVKVGFKLQSNQPDIYWIETGKVVLNPKQTKQMDIELSDKFTHQQFNKVGCKPGHKFKLQSIRWPSGDLGTFEETWNAEKKKATGMSTVIVGVELSA